MPGLPGTCKGCGAPVVLKSSNNMQKCQYSKSLGPATKLRWVNAGNGKRHQCGMGE